MNSILLLGGGLDSIATFLFLKKNGMIFDCLWIDYGQKAASSELKYIQWWCKKYKVNLIQDKDDSLIKQFNPQPNKLFGTGEEPYIDARNLVLLMRAALYSNLIMLGLTEETAAKDTTNNFLYHINEVFSCSFFNQKKEIVAPLLSLNFNKRTASEMAYKIDNKFFDKTMTCWLPKEEEECGECRHCKIKKEIEFYTKQGVS